ncbi:hypothetical protein P872_01495 [Rhodonellum psychrophilum GCM71 = DSM 17998]|uniref:Glycosyl transferase family 1 domain-containing protein n=2 Tax=Rhodonellum TaxID=336827 RepID=U5C6Z5_9BACT|nr:MULTISPECIES: glycosyltransferase [Rhodonellum]ERM83962.1 hypothetical protein P872_01495 [Rhodonellum psychrophilum GCM71 = DSM 17998]SDZ05607.1 Glycosyltransferase involved in cell wall bisynthesis [Rhodonellum ikkaensis]
MIKIVLVTFYFSPCTLTPAQRISYWAKNLNKIGIYPIVVTRDWEANIKSHFDTKKPFGKEIKHEKFETHEVYYLPFKPGLLDKAYSKFGETKWRPLFILAKILDVLLIAGTLKFTSYANFFPFLTELKKTEDFEKVIISGEPFYLFKIGYLISKKLKLTWIADYRDDWSTNELQKAKSGRFIRTLISKLEAHYEKRWVGSAKFIISVSENYTKRISEFINVPGVTVANGFEEEILDLPPENLFEDFTVVYSGTLYPSQNIKLVLGALKIALENGNPFRLVFLGSGFDIKEKKRIDSLVEDSLKPYVQITDRLPRMEALTFIKKAHAVLAISYGDMKGIPSSKLYEYIGLKKPVLLCPSDHDVMEQILKDVGLGYFADNAVSCFEQIMKIRSGYKKEGFRMEVDAGQDKILKYSRFHQLMKLKNLI